MRKGKDLRPEDLTVLQDRIRSLEGDLEVTLKENAELRGRLKKEQLFEQWVDTHIQEGVAIYVSMNSGKYFTSIVPVSQDRYNIMFIANSDNPGVSAGEVLSIRKQAIEYYKPVS